MPAHNNSMRIIFQVSVNIGSIGNRPVDIMHEYSCSSIVRQFIVQFSICRVFFCACVI